MNKCSICNSEELDAILELKKYPAYIVPVPKSISLEVVKADISLYCCRGCGHLQLLNPDKELQRLIYEEYYSYYVVDSSETFSPHYRKPFVDFFEDLKTKGFLENKKTLLEIGCSSGQQVEFFKKYAGDYLGIDPSTKIDVAIKEFPNEKFIKGYFPQSIPDLNFDLIVSQFNLEHILDVQAFVSKIHFALNPNGLFILQVPDISDFVRNKMPNFLAHEHIQYFTKNTLSKLLESQGFENILWGEQSPSLIVAAQKKNKPATYNFKNQIENSTEANKQIVFNFNNLPNNLKGNIVFYGIGPQLYWLLSSTNNINYVVCDDNPNYEAQGLPGYGKEILKPSKDIFTEYNHVVLSLNKFYHQTVLEKLKNYHLPMQVYLIDNQGNWTIEKI